MLLRAALGRPVLTGATALAIVSASTAALASTVSPGRIVDRLSAAGVASSTAMLVTQRAPFGVSQGRPTSRVYDALRAGIRAERVADARRTARAAYRKALLSKNPKVVARAMLTRFGWGASQFSCLDSLWTRESKWNIHATNPSSGAYGIPQALPGTKMSSAGPDWRNNPITQIAWGLGYIQHVYGSPCGAWGHSEGHGWY